MISEVRLLCHAIHYHIVLTCNWYLLQSLHQVCTVLSEVRLLCHAIHYHIVLTCNWYLLQSLHQVCTMLSEVRLLCHAIHYYNVLTCNWYLLQSLHQVCTVLSEVRLLCKTSPKVTLVTSSDPENTHIQSSIITTSLVLIQIPASIQQWHGTTHHLPWCEVLPSVA